MIQDKNLPIKEKYLLYLEDVPKHKWASKACRINENTSKRWRDDDPDFADRCEEALSKWVHKNVKKSSPEFQLERLLADDFKERKDVTSGDKPIPIYPINVSGNVSHQEDKSTQ
jgi:hypothetical protein